MKINFELVRQAVPTSCQRGEEIDDDTGMGVVPAPSSIASPAPADVIVTPGLQAVLASGAHEARADQGDGEVTQRDGGEAATARDPSEAFESFSVEKQVQASVTGGRLILVHRIPEENFSSVDSFLMPDDARSRLFHERNW